MRGGAGDEAREGGRKGGGGGGRLEAALRSEEEDAGWRECMLESDGSRSCSAECLRRGLGGTGVGERWSWLPSGGLREETDGVFESAASFSKRERRLLTAGGAHVSMPSEFSGTVIAPGQVLSAGDQDTKEGAGSAVRRVSGGCRQREMRRGMACNASSQLRTLSNTAETPHHCHSRRHPASVTVTLPRPTDRLRASARKRQLEAYPRPTNASLRSSSTQVYENQE